jgi:hypothetical protein
MESTMVDQTADSMVDL